MAAEARSVVVRLTAENAQYIAAMRASGAVTDATATQVEAAARRQSAAFDTLGSKAGKAGLAAALGLAAMGKAAVDWESQFAGVEKTVDGTASELGVLEGELRGLAKAMPATHEEIAGVAEAAGQLGVAREDISEFTETMVQLGETTNLTAQDAATSIAQMANVMGTAPDEISKVGAALVALGNDGASTEAEILGMAQRIAGAGAQIGLAESDILGIANAAASMGIEVEAGGTAISKVFTELAKATAQGGDDLDAFADIAGMSAEEFTKAFEDDPAAAFASFTEGLNRINESGGDVFTTLDQLGLADVRVSRALLSMASSGDLLTDSLALGADAFEQNTALTDEYGKRLETTASQTQLAWNQIKDAGITAGNELLPAIAQVAGVVGDLASAFGQLPQPVQSSLTGLLGMTALLGGGLWFGTKVVGGVTSTRAALADLATTSPRAARGLTAVAKAGGALVALEVGTALIDSLREAAKGAAPDIDELNAALAETDAAALSEALGGSLAELLDAADTGKLEDLAAGVGEFVDSMGYAGDVIDVFAPGMHGMQDQADRTAEAVNSLDEALAMLAAAEGPDRAVAAFRELADAEGLSAGAQKELLDLLPAFRAATAGAADGSDELAGSQSGLADLLDVTGDAADDTAGDLDELAGSAETAAGAMDALAGFLDREAAMRAYAEAVKETGKALKDGFQPKDIETIHGIGEEIKSAFDSLEGRGKGAKRSFLKEAKADLEAFIQSNPNAKAVFGDLLKFVNRGLDALDNTEAEPSVGMDDREFRGGAEAVRRQTKALNFLKANPDVDLEDGAFQMRFGLTKRDLNWLNGAEATAELYADASGVSRGIGLARAALNNLNGMTVTTYIATRHLPQNNAAGGLYDNGVKTFADGGYGQDGRYYSRQPQMVQGGANIMWGEKETGWEAYISGKPSERSRNIDILGMAAERLGVGLVTHAKSFANGGSIDSWIGPNPVDSWIGRNPHRDRDRDDLPPYLADLFRTLDQLDNGLRGLSKKELRIRERDIDRAEKSLEKWADKREELAEKEVDADKERLETMLQARDAFSEQVEGLFKSNVFENQGPIEYPDNFWQMSDEEKTAWYADQERQKALQSAAGLQGDINDLRRAMELYKGLVGRGFDGPAFRDLVGQADVQTLEYFSKLSDAELQSIETLYNERDRLSQQAGNFLGNSEFGEEIKGLRFDYRESVGELRETRKENREFERAAERRFRSIERKMDEVAEEIGDRVAKGVNNAAVAGRAGQAPG